MNQGLLLFAHGARDPNWALPFEDVARRVRMGRPALQVELCFLEFMQPSLIDGGTRLAMAGCTQVDIVPLFLGAGGHVRRDLPVLLEQLREMHRETQWTLRPAIGEQASVIEAMARCVVAWSDESA